MKRVDLTGEHFGSFTVRRRDPELRSTTRWILQCACGREISRQTQQLRAGAIPPCNCEFENRLSLLPETIKAYLSGLYDGEGSMYIGLQSRSGSIPLHFLEISIVNTHKPVLDWIMNTCGGRVSRKPTLKTPQVKPCWSWKASAQQAASFLRVLLPYLIVKRAQAEIAIAFQRRVSAFSITAWTSGMTESESAWRDDQRKRLIEIRKAG